MWRNRSSLLSCVCFFIFLGFVLVLSKFLMLQWNSFLLSFYLSCTHVWTTEMQLNIRIWTLESLRSRLPLKNDYKHNFVMQIGERLQSLWFQRVFVGDSPFVTDTFALGKRTIDEWSETLSKGSFCSSRYNNGTTVNDLLNDTSKYFLSSCIHLPPLLSSFLFFVIALSLFRNAYIF